jgi:hypothetical protein
MPTAAWILEGTSIGEGDEVANSLAARVVLLQADTADVSAIKAVTDNLPNSGALTSISDETDKIDGAATDGLAGVSNSLAYRANEIERHLHGWERWFGLAGAPDAEVHRADRIGTTVTAFQADGGNNTWGSWLQVLGSSDTPADVGQAKYDLHRIQVVAVERTNATHFVQIALGASGAAALASGDYTELVFHPQSVQAQEVPVDMIMRRKDATTKAWLRCWVVGQNTGTMDFFVGVHEYAG